MNNLHSHFKNLVKREKAEELLSPHHSTLQLCCTEGHAKWLEFASQMPHLRFPLEPRTVANMINDWIVQEVRMRFLGANGIEIVEDPGFVCLAFHKLLLVRFKKSDSDGRTSNVQTEQQKQIAAQTFDFGDDYENPTWVTVGYHLTRLYDAVDKISSFCWYVDSLLWSIPIFDSTAKPADLLPFAEAPKPVSKPVKKVRVRPKNLKKPEGHE